MQASLHAASLQAAPLQTRWEAAAHLVVECRDLLDARIGEHRDAEAPLASRGWSEFLASIDDAELAEIEARGHDAAWPETTPWSLRGLVDRVRAACDVPPMRSIDAIARSARPARRGETPRKRAQVDAFANVILPLAARARRVVDVGSGHGHLTREIAERIALPVVGLERSAALAERARRLSSAASPTFDVTDVLRDGLALEAGDCAIGLHACGELGDALALSVAARGASLALVSCCLQKRTTRSRAPLAAPPALAPSLDLPRDLLGLSNLSAGDVGVEASRTENLAARERRIALHRLVSDASGPIRFGAEIEGLNRRAAHAELDSLVARAFAHRRLPLPSAAAIAEAAAWARVHHARMRRLSLPRALLARLLEVFVLYDRALFLESNGFSVTTGTLFPAAVSARNLVLVAEVTRLGDIRCVG